MPLGKTNTRMLTGTEYDQWNAAYSTVYTTSGSWGGGGSVDTGVRALTGNWQNTYTTFSTQSANNLSVYSTVQANSGTSTWGFSRVAQVVTVQDATAKSTTVTAPLNDTVPQLSSYTIYNELSAIITPTNSSSTLIIDVLLPVFQNAASTAVFSLFNSTAGNSLALATVGQSNAPSYYVQTRLRYIVSAGSTAQQSFYLGFARTTGSTATVRINDGTTPYWGDTQRSSMTITEIRP